MRYIIFSEETQKFTDKCLDKAKDIYAEYCSDLDDIRFSAGLSAYGKSYGSYRRDGMIIDICVNPTFKRLKITTNGLDISGAVEYEGTVMHELAHHASYYAPAPYNRNNKITHQTTAWLWAICLGWKYYYPEFNLTPEIITKALKNDSTLLAPILSCWKPNKSPEVFIKAVNDALAKYQKVCAQCNLEFVSTRLDAKFCKASCRVAASRIKKAYNALEKVKKPSCKVASYQLVKVLIHSNKLNKKKKINIDYTPLS